MGGGGGERGKKIISMKQTFITQGGVGDGLLIRMEGWEVVVVATALIDGVFTGSYKQFIRFRKNRLWLFIVVNNNKS